MCGIAGIVDLERACVIDRARLGRMAAALTHRGPDEDGFHVETGLGLASRRLSIVGLADGRQPITNEDGSVVVVFNGELFDHRAERAWLEGRGHRFRTSCDTEIIVHLWEELGEEFFTRLRGQFAFALYDARQRVMILARDRVGICPLHWARRGDWLYFGSEIKAILASGDVPRAADPRGLDHVFTFFGMPSWRTPFAGIQSIPPGRYLKLQFAAVGARAELIERTYWDLDFPEYGDEVDPPSPERVRREFRELFFAAVEKRLRADVPVVSYLSGGIDSAMVAAAATQLRGPGLPTFTVQIDSPRFDERQDALEAATYLGTNPTIVTCDAGRLSEAYARTVWAAEGPVVDTSSAALHCLSREVHDQGFKVALSGEGADEALAGYPWFKINRLLGLLDHGRFRPSNLARRLVRLLIAPETPRGNLGRIQRLIGGPHAHADLYRLYSAARGRLYGEGLRNSLGDFLAYEDLELDVERIRRWHPLNQSLYFGYKTMLPGLLLNHKGDRVAMANSVETRYPFLDEDLVEYCARIHPRWKLRGLTGDKRLLREVAAEHLPPAIVRRPKAMFRAPLADTFLLNSPKFISELLSPVSLRKTGYFDPASVARDRAAYPRYRWAGGRRLIVEMGLTAVVATQLWHHLFLGGGLCTLDVPDLVPPEAIPSLALPIAG